MEAVNMWGDIDMMANIRTPQEIIEEQGTFLTKMTNGTLELKLERKQSKTVYNYDVFLVCPKLKSKQRLFRLTHDIKLYPANLFDENGTNEFRSKDQGEFEENLATILTSMETKMTISGLMAQTRLGGHDVFV